MRNGSSGVLGAFRRRPVCSSLNLAGLSISLALSFVIGIYVLNERSYDLCYAHAKDGRVYRITLRELESRGTDIRGALSAPPFAPVIMKEFPDLVQAVARCRRKDTDIHYGSPIVQSEKLAESESRFYWVDPSFFDVFTVKFIAGDPEAALVKPDTIVLTESMSRKYFASANPIGRKLKVDDAEYRVTGIVQDFPLNTHLHMDFMASMESVDDSRATYFIKNNYYTYVLLKEGVEASEFNVRLDYIVAKYFDADLRKWLHMSLGDMARKGNHLWFYLHPVSQIHLTPHDFEAEQTGNATQCRVLGQVALLLLLLAGINFGNLLAAMDSGGSRPAFFRSLGQGVLLGAVAGCIALALCPVLLPLVKHLRSDGQTVPLFQPWWTVPAALATAMTVALGASGLRWMLGRIDGAGVKRARMVWAVVEFGVAAGVVVAALAAGRQVHYMQTKDLGMTRDEIVVLKEVDGLRERMQPFKTDLRASPAIAAVSDSATLPGRQFRAKSHSLALKSEGGDLLTLWQITTDEGFANAFGLTMAQGRFFSPTLPNDFHGAVVNETAARLLGLNLGTTLYEHSPGTPYKFQIIGIVKDFHAASMRKAIAPTAIKLLHYQPGRVGRFVSVRVKRGMHEQATAHIARVWKKYLPRRTVESMDFASDYDKLLAPERTTATVLGVFAVLALVYGCWALLAASLGRPASAGTSRMAAHTAGYVLLSSAFTVPPGYLLARQWVLQFHYYIEPGPWVIVATLLLICGLAYATAKWAVEPSPARTAIGVAAGAGSR